MNLRAASTAVLAASTFAAATEDEESPSAFRFEMDRRVRTAIDTTEIRRGIPLKDPRDGIPAIWEPKAVAAKEAGWLTPGDRVLGVVVGKEARAYPIRILARHEMVNDVLGGRPVAPNY